MRTLPVGVRETERLGLRGAVCSAKSRIGALGCPQTAAGRADVLYGADLVLRGMLEARFAGMQVAACDKHRVYVAADFYERLTQRIFGPERRCALPRTLGLWSGIHRSVDCGREPDPPTFKLVSTGSASLPAMLANGSGNLDLPKQRPLHRRGIELVRLDFTLPKGKMSVPDDGGAVQRRDSARPLLDVRGLSVGIGRDGYRIVDDIAFSLRAGETLGIVGESGCGKSLTSLALMGLLPERLKSSGEVWFGDVDLLTLAASDMRELRGNRLAMIFQDPMTSLNPALTIGYQIAESLMRHRKVGHGQARREAIALLRKVKLSAPEQRIDAYPHQLSGGMRQRVMIAMALICKPSLLIADEPTTALDVTVQAQILDLLRELREELGSAMIFISHDLGVVAENADRVAVLYAGRIVEQGPTRSVFEHPQHPYTIGLIGSIPRIDVAQDWLPTIPGSLPIRSEPASGCRFAPRCPFADDACGEVPRLRELRPDHRAACWKAPL